MKKLFTILAMVLATIIISSCSDSGTNPQNSVVKSKEMPNFLFPLNVANKWDYTEIKTEPNGKKDTLNYTLSLKNHGIKYWTEEKGNLETYEIISTLKESYGWYKAPSYLDGNGDYGQIISKKTDTLLIGEYDWDGKDFIYTSHKIYASFQELPFYYPLMPSGIKINQQYSNMQFDTVFVFKSNWNDEYLTELHFAKGIGLVYWNQYDMKYKFFNEVGHIKSYSVK